MKKNEEEKIGFDLSALELKELIEVYENIEEFLEFLGESKIVIEKEEDVKDEQ